MKKKEKKEKNKESSEKKKHKNQKLPKDTGDHRSGKKKKNKKHSDPSRMIKQEPLITEENPAAEDFESSGKELNQVQIYRALGDESRLQILDILREQEMCAADLLKLVPIVQSTLSHHMKILCESGLVLCRRQARWSYYSVNKQLFREAADRLKKWSE